MITHVKRLKRRQFSLKIKGNNLSKRKRIYGLRMKMRTDLLREHG